jgi:hypothetical protein
METPLILDFFNKKNGRKKEMTTSKAIDCKEDSFY